jgi:hypothetical protein
MSIARGAVYIADDEEQRELDGHGGVIRGGLEPSIAVPPHFLLLLHSVVGRSHHAGVGRMLYAGAGGSGGRSVQEYRMLSFVIV